MTGSDRTPDPLDPVAAIRVGTADRERAVALLHDAVGAGYLDLQEFEERSTRAYAARTRGELRPVLDDLPTADRLFPATAHPGGPSAAAGGALVATPSETIDVDWTNVRRRGVWSIPAVLAVVGSMGSADLDFSHSPFPAGGCVVDVSASWSTVKVTVDGATVIRTTDWQGGSMSTLKDKAGPPTAPGGGTLDIRGRTSWTTIVLRRN